MRRQFVLIVAIAVSLLAAGPRATAQAPAQGPRVGILSTGVPRSAPLWQAFDRRLRELGWIDGQNVEIEFKNAEGKIDSMPSLAAELARGTNVLVAPGSAFTVRAIRPVAGSRPIVIIAVDYDPLALGFVDSEAHPGGNITGVFLQQPELARKRLELVKEALPRATRVAVLWDTTSADQFKAALQVAPSLKVELRPRELRNPPYDFDGALREAVRERADAVLLPATPLAFQNRAQIARLAIARRIPIMAAFPEYADAGGLMGYGPDMADMFRRGAEYVDKILRGAKPADLPVEQPTVFQFVLNMKAARALGLAFPTSIQVRADRVIP